MMEKSRLTEPLVTIIYAQETIFNILTWQNLTKIILTFSGVEFMLTLVGMTLILHRAAGRGTFHSRLLLMTVKINDSY